MNVLFSDSCVTNFTISQALQALMTEESSPILDYYPPEFECDLNGKQQEWEAVVLIPFIDEKRLLEAVEPRYPSMTAEEKQRKTLFKPLSSYCPLQNNNFTLYLSF